MMFERIKRALGIEEDQGLTDAGRGHGYADDRDRQQSREQQSRDRLPEERQRLGGGERSKTALAEKRQEMIEEQLQIEERARESDSGLNIDAPHPSNDDRSDREILTARMAHDMGSRQKMMATDDYNEIDMRREYWWHPAFNQSDRAKARRTGADPLLDDDRDGRQVSHYDDWSLAWDEPEFSNEQGGFIPTNERERKMMLAKERVYEQEQNRTREPEQQDRDRRAADADDRRARDARDSEQERQDREQFFGGNLPEITDEDRDHPSPDELDDRDRQQSRKRDVQDRYFGAMSEETDEQLPTFDDDDISGSVTPDRDDLDEREREERDRDRNRQRGRGR